MPLNHPQTEPLNGVDAHRGNPAKLIPGVKSSQTRGPDGRLRRRKPLWDVAYRPVGESAALTVNGVEADDEAGAVLKVMEWIAARPGDLQLADDSGCCEGSVVVRQAD